MCTIVLVPVDCAQLHVWWWYAFPEFAFKRLESWKYHFFHVPLRNVVAMISYSTDEHTRVSSTIARRRACELDRLLYIYISATGMKHGGEIIAELRINDQQEVDVCVCVCVWRCEFRSSQVFCDDLIFGIRLSIRIFNGVLLSRDKNMYARWGDERRKQCVSSHYPDVSLHRIIIMIIIIIIVIVLYFVVRLSCRCFSSVFSY